MTGAAQPTRALPAPGTVWRAPTQEHKGFLVRVLACNGHTVRVENLRGSSAHRKQIHHVPLDSFYVHYELYSKGSRRG